MRINDLALDRVQIEFDEIKHLTPYHIADLLELRLLFGQDDEFSKADFEDLLRDNSVFDKRSIGRLEWLRSDPRLNSFDTPEDLYIHCVWNHLNFRKYNFYRNSPFEFEDEILRLNIRVDYMEIQKEYVTLLLCSKLRLIKSKSQQIYMANEFETICKKAMKNIFSSGTETFCFGPGSEDRLRFGNKLQDGIKSLGKYLGETIRPNVEDISNSGDYGLDIVTLLNKDLFGSGSLFFLGQCAAMELEDDWKKKKKQATDILDIIDASSSPLVGLFIPVVFRKDEGSWFNSARVRQVSVFDRVRLISMLNI